MIDKEQIEQETEQREQEGQEQEVQDTSVRGALKAAIKEASERDDGEEVKEDKIKGSSDERKSDEVARRLEKARQAKTDKAAAKPRGDVGDVSRDNLAKPPQKEEKKEEQKEVKVEGSQGKSDPPPFWKSKAKEVWDTLSPAAQEAVIKREKEVSDGFAQYGQKTRAFDELARVIEPHMPAIQRYGVTVPQTIERLFGWMSALSTTDENARVNAFKTLAQSFNVNLARLAPQAVEGQNQETQVDTSQPPPWFNQFAGQIQNKLQTVEQQAQQLAQHQQTQVESAATNWLNNWAKDKPYFQQVRNQMKHYFETGQIPPLEGGALDLDGAYNAAVANNIQVQAQIKQETEAKAKAEADDKAKKDAADSAARLAKARRAGSSLRPAAPTIATAAQSRPNGAAGRRETVRESLIKSIQQAQDNA